jgi:DNA ligase D-like protein (predicted ligase)/DNA ligase D-like protein (predicted 3'-phosphoesterase)
MATASHDALTSYHHKRNFAATPEPKGRVARRKGRSFVIQKHAATRLHFDFRLELDGVLKSWAVTKGPSLDPSQKRLAVRVEDHPLDYGGFEGTIPEGQYGGGTVMLWDRGEWQPEGDPHEGLKKGKFSFTLKGKRLKGGFTLLRMRKDRGKSTRENWLLIKQRDTAASEEIDPVEKWQRSVATRRSMDGIAKAANGRIWQAKKTKKKRSRRASLPPFVAPHLAFLEDHPPEGPNWIHEIKYDGYRVLAAVADEEVKLYTRSGQDWTEKFKPIAEAFAKLGIAALIDGEVVVFEQGGRTSFQALQEALSERRQGDLRYVAFDLLRLEGEDLRRKPLTERKKRLKALLGKVRAPLTYGDHIAGDSEKVLAEACRLGVEGLVSKDRNSTYVSGRTSTWIKSKCLGRSEFVIGGYRPSDKKGRSFASLLIGEFGKHGLIYKGRVGTGYDEAILRSLGAKLKAREIDKSPFTEVPRMIRSRARWVKPELVAEIAFTERTRDGILRHPVFLGLREDKRARDVTGEDRMEPAS